MEFAPFGGGPEFPRSDLPESPRQYTRRDDRPLRDAGQVVPRRSRALARRVAGRTDVSRAVSKSASSLSLGTSPAKDFSPPTEQPLL